MTLIDETLNVPATWEKLLEENKRRTEVDLAEVERVIELARRTPGLFEYESALHQISIFFAVATQFYKKQDPDGLAQLVAFWERYRGAVIQRYTSVTPVELRAADKIIENIFNRFLLKVPNEMIAYDPSAHPLVFGGEGGLGAYFTHPPGWNRPFAIINLPHAAFDNVWQWLALPHETGHDTYATVEGLASELEDALDERMQTAVDDGEVAIPDVTVDLSPLGVSHSINYSGGEFLGKLWRAWANEAQADMVGLLNCGAATAVTLQQIIGFSNEDTWSVRMEDGDIVDEPEEHPTSYIRNALNISALRLIDSGSHSAVADEVEKRYKALRPSTNDVVWRIGRTFEFARISADEMIKSSEIATELLLNFPLQSLGNQAYSSLASFTAQDQGLVEQIVQPLLDGDPTFADGSSGVEPRHALAATIFAFESDPQRADTINRTLMHFI